MNILFVCHNDFASNSMNHIRGFARGLGALGHACAAAVPDNYAPTREALEQAPPFRPVLFSEVWTDVGALFPDRQPADVIHAWTPREHVRRAVGRCREAMPTADLVVHMEDNEQHLSEVYAKTGYARLRHLSDGELAAKLPLNLSHPRRHLDLLRSADGVTGIVAELADFVPAGVPFAEQWPAVDFERYHPGPPDPGLRAALGIRSGEKILCYTGNSHFANGAEVQSLYEAVFLLNRQGVPCRLVRTGVDAADFPPRFPPGELARYIVDLGFVEPARLPGLLRLADVLVQPGERNRFNTHRLPSKLPEFLAAGRPVVMPRANVGLRVRPGEEALVLETGTPEEIAENCRRVFSDGALAARLSAGGAAFARRHFDPATHSRALVRFYEEVGLLWRRPRRPASGSAPAAG